MSLLVAMLVLITGVVPAVEVIGSVAVTLVTVPCGPFAVLENVSPVSPALAFENVCLAIYAPSIEQ
jgi:hypothetical protein